ncbi:HATPase_c domain-containing protein [Haematococcus lacustris]|uniref:HATPase_c domain-containing protein n=1 Tax=Haematococcus lacustris TaxID=44745 RepID=A0A699ZFL3_HAELA|nr:HATPase_c domain-containing protein [Haematococcus lacustris]
MDILINSLYSNKDIFLRELISNASDALDKIRFLSLTNKEVLGEGDNAKLEIQISLDKANRVLMLRDRGVGMTKQDLIKNLGTIAKSGTSAFLETMQQGGDVNLIGQFGVGFYSVYLVADWVEVVTKHNDDEQYVWSSSASGGFSIAKDTEGEPLGRGTLIKLHLKPEAMEYAEESKLRELVGRYSDAWPPYQRLVSADAPKKTRKVKRNEWDLLNDAKAIWLRSPKDVSKEDYHKFYKAVSKDVGGDPLGWVHFKAEGDVEFKTVIFVPKTAPHDFYDKYYDKGAKGALKLYVRRVFITDDAEELVPRWLGFLRGLVDSDTLPLNVSREVMQQHAALKTIRKKLVRKVLDLIKSWADDEAKCRKAEKDKEEGKEADADEEVPTGRACELYGDFWMQYGKAMKLGVIEDITNRGRLAKLLRFYTSKSPSTHTSLDEYVARMKPGQKDIYYLAGSSKEEIEKSPFLEQLLRKGYEVIYFTDVLDEYVMQHMVDYEDKKFANASKEDLKMADKDEVEKKKDKELREEFKKLTSWWKTVLGSAVSSVKVSSRLSTTPCVVVAGKYGQSANMERIMRAQAFNDPSRAMMGGSQKVLEINPRHPLIRALKDKHEEAGADDEEVVGLASLLYQASLLESGFMLDQPKMFNSRVQGLVGARLGLAPDAKVELDDEAEAAPEGEEAKEEAAAAESEDGEEEEAMPEDKAEAAAPAEAGAAEDADKAPAKDEL